MQKVQREVRIANELNLIQQTQEDHPAWKVVKSNKDQWEIQINCDITYPYNGPPFHLLVTFPPKYPQVKAEIVVKEKQTVYHPNINFLTGAICQTVVQLNDITLMIKDRVNQFMAFLKQPNSAHGLNNLALNLYKENPKEYHKTALSIYRKNNKN